MAYQSNFKGDEVVALLNMVKNGGAGAVVRNLFTGDTLLDEEKAYNAETYQMVMEAEIPPIIMWGGGLPMYIDKHSTSTDTSIRIYYHVHIGGEHGVSLCKLGSDGTVIEEMFAYDCYILYDKGDTTNTGVFNALQSAAILGNIIIEDAELGILRPVQIIPVDENSAILIATEYNSGPFVNLVAYIVTSDDIVSRNVVQGPAAGGGEVLYLHKDEGDYTEQEQAANGAVLEAIKQGTLSGAAVVNYDGEYYTVVTAYTMTFSGEDEFFIVATNYSSGKLLFINKTGVQEFSMSPQTVIYINEGQTEEQKKENFINLLYAVEVHRQSYPIIYFRDGDKYYTSLGSIGPDWFFWDIQNFSVGVVTVNIDSDAGTLETTVERIPLNLVFGSLSAQIVVVPIGRELTDSEKQSNVEAYEAITKGMNLIFADCGSALCFAKAYLDTVGSFVIDVPTDSGVTTYKVVLAEDGTVTTTELGGSSAGTTDTTAVVEFVTSGELTAEQKATNAAVYSRIANGEKVVTFFKRNGEAYLMPMLHTDYDGHNVFFDLLQAFSSESGEATLGVAHIVMSSDGTVTASESTLPLSGNSVEAAILEFNSDGSALTTEQKAHNAKIYQKIFNNETVQVYLNVGTLVPLQSSSVSGTEIILSASAIITADSGSLRYQSLKLSSDGDLQMYEQKEYPLTGGSGSESELREIYVADALDESQKAYNAETYNKIREGAGVLPYIKGANGAPRYLCNFTLWGGSTPYITMKTYVFDTLQDGEYTYLLVKLMSDGTASSQDNEKTLSSLAVDSTLSSTSENPVQNKVVKTKFNEVDSWLTRLQNTVNGWGESLEELLGYFTEGKANDADKLDGHDSSHFATSEAVTQLSQKVDAIPTITVDSAIVEESANPVQSKVIKAYVDDMKVMEVSQSAITQIELMPNTLYRLSDITSLVVTLAQGEVGVANYYMFEIAVGDAIPEITLPSSVRWMDGYDVLADLNKDTVYQISILNNLAVGGAFV